MIHAQWILSVLGGSYAGYASDAIQDDAKSGIATPSDHRTPPRSAEVHILLEASRGRVKNGRFTCSLKR